MSEDKKRVTDMVEDGDMIEVGVVLKGGRGLARTETREEATRVQDRDQEK